MLEWLPDGSYLSFIADSAEKAKNSYRLRHGLAKITDLPEFYVRAVDYKVTDRGDGEEIITLETNITDPEEIPAAELAAFASRSTISRATKPGGSRGISPTTLAARHQCWSVPGIHRCLVLPG